VTVRIKFIIPFPFDEEGVANRAAQIPREILGPNTEVECVPVRNSATMVTDYYESMLFDMYIAEAGLRAEEEGYDAVVMDTVSDSGLYALRSRLTIPVIGPGLVSYAVAIMLGKRFSIVTMWDKWRHLYEKNLDVYHLWEKCASIRAVNIPPDVETLFAGKEEEMFEKLTAEGRKAIEEDGADVILLGSTTMHQAGDYMSAHLPAPVINPGPVAIKMAETIVELGLSHSKVAFPTPPVIQDEKFFSLIGADGTVRTV
jgi:allantoin racemase